MIQEKAREILVSRNAVDKRLADLYRVKKVNEEFAKLNPK